MESAAGIERIGVELVGVELVGVDQWVRQQLPAFGLLEGALQVGDITTAP